MDPIVFPMLAVIRGIRAAGIVPVTDLPAHERGARPFHPARAQEHTKMQRSRANAFTLVEILIVVVILGILAAIVIPQFTNASESAVRSTLKSQLQTIVSQIELYRVRNRGVYPTLGTGQSDGGWGVLITESYLKEPPLNSYVGLTDLETGDDTVMAADRDSATYGWATDGSGNVWAVGYDPTPVAGFPDGKLSHE